MQKPKSVKAIKKILENTGVTFSVTAFLARSGLGNFSQYSNRDLIDLEQKALQAKAEAIHAGVSNFLVLP